MRPFFVALIIVALAGHPVAAGAQMYDVKPLRFVRIANGSPVVLDQLRLAGPRGRMPGDACLAFHDADPRRAKSVAVALVYYDDAGNRAGGDVFTQNGEFANGVPIVPFVRPNVEHNTDCLVMHLPRHGFSEVAYYVDRVDFDDGSVWKSPLVAIPEHSADGFAVVRPAPASLAAGEARPSAVTGSNLPPVVLGVYADCATALAAAPARTPVFAGDAVAPLSSDRDALVEAQPGAAAGGDVVRVGATSLCRSTGDPLRDTAAIDAVTHAALSLTGSAVFRVYFPAYAVPAACDEPARLMLRRQANATFELNELPPKPGVYAGTVHVSVSDGGVASDAHLKAGTRVRAYDDALKQSALTSRYWPQISNGEAVAGGFDFEMRWVIAASTERGIASRTRTAIQSFAAPDPSCR